MRKLSITMRITIWYVIFLVLITGLFFSIVFYTGNAHASGLAKTRLMEAVVDACDEINTVGEDFMIDKDLDFYQDGVYLSIYDSSSDLIEGRRPRELKQLPDLQDKTVTRCQDEEHTVWYIYDSCFDLNGRTIWVRGIVKDFAEESMFSFMMKIAAVAFPLLVLLAILGGWIISKRAFRPVRNIIETAEEISRDRDLSRRILIDAKDTHSSVSTSGRDSQDEIYQLTVTFNQLFDELQRAFEKEKQFTSDVSHELRTPLAVILSQSEYALEDPEYREQALTVIRRETKRMTGLVNDLLTMARSEKGRLALQKEDVDLSGMCEAVLQQQESAAQKKGIRLEADLEENLSIQADGSMVIRILLNLIENGIKYGSTGGTVWLRLNRQGSVAQIRVEDDGVGIPAKDLPHIWERFYRVEASRSEEGTGLGLSMVKALAEAHGGRVCAENRAGSGACFIVELPVKAVWNKDEAADAGDKEERGNEK